MFSPWSIQYKHMKFFYSYLASGGCCCAWKDTSGFFPKLVTISKKDKNLIFPLLCDWQQILWNKLSKFLHEGEAVQ